MYHAVHLRSESGDDYIFLINTNDPKKLVAQIIEECPEELAYISECHMQTEDPKYAEKFANALYDAIEKGQEGINDE